MAARELADCELLSFTVHSTKTPANSPRLPQNSHYRPGDRFGSLRWAFCALIPRDSGFLRREESTGRPPRSSSLSLSIFDATPTLGINLTLQADCLDSLVFSSLRTWAITWPLAITWHLGSRYFGYVSQFNTLPSPGLLDRPSIRYSGSSAQYWISCRLAFFPVLGSESAILALIPGLWVSPLRMAVPFMLCWWNIAKR